MPLPMPKVASAVNPKTLLPQKDKPAIPSAVTPPMAAQAPAAAPPTTRAVTPPRPRVDEAQAQAIKNPQGLSARWRRGDAEPFQPRAQAIKNPQGLSARWRRGDAEPPQPRAQATKNPQGLSARLNPPPPKP